MVTSLALDQFFFDTFAFRDLLLGRLVETGIFECDCRLRCKGCQQAFILLSESIRLFAFDTDHTDDLLANLERHIEPGLDACMGIHVK